MSVTLNLTTQIRQDPDGTNPNVIKGYLLLWGSPDQRDLMGEYFTPRTALGSIDRKIPIKIFDSEGDMLTIGMIDKMQVDEYGIKVEGHLDDNRYTDVNLRLIEKGVWYWAAGSLPQLVDIVDEGANKGEILSWHLEAAFMTATPSMTNIERVVDTGAIDKHLKDWMYYVAIPDDDLVVKKTVSIPPAPVEDSRPIPNARYQRKFGDQTPVRTLGQESNPAGNVEVFHDQVYIDLDRNWPGEMGRKETLHIAKTDFADFAEWLYIVSLRQKDDGVQPSAGTLLKSILRLLRSL